MTATPTFPSRISTPILWLRRTEAWLDARGRGAWIASMVLGLIVAWPLGLALLAYMVFAGKFVRQDGAAARTVPLHGSSGNRAFDAYKAETLRRLQEEQDEFTAFLHRLREAKDKAEFDQFMADRGARDATSDQTDRDDA